ncbi:hypothetical protein SAMN05216593_10111 [Pseudomonas asturiensis]|uniref:Uncharacterized protein n=1 Tax=Pseudomonas asturiensis TaxID=1190415 RepID=A0A1M7IYX2_9PSED|nr:hypothetical protein [Pseudomonas asturiensis]SHM45901.1 hypothetical protein SAMN05216593_10111 [Pseudomonas asturiensis]
MKLPEIHYPSAWANAVDAQEQALRGASNAGGEGRESRAARLALGPYKLTCFLHNLRCKYSTPWLDLSPAQAGQLYLINKHHWLPGAFQNTEASDMLYILHEELMDLQLTSEQFQPIRESASHLPAWADLAAEGNQE